MKNLNLEEILDVYKKIGIPIDDDVLSYADLYSQNVSQNQKSIPFGIYVENGFNYSNNTNIQSN